VLLGGVGGAKTQLTRDFGSCRRHAGIRDKSLDEPQNLGLARGEVGHFGLPVYPYSNCDYIQIMAHGKKNRFRSALAKQKERAKARA